MTKRALPTLSMPGYFCSSLNFFYYKQQISTQTGLKLKDSGLSPTLKSLLEDQTDLDPGLRMISGLSLSNPAFCFSLNWLYLRKTFPG